MQLRTVCDKCLYKSSNTADWKINNWNELQWSLSEVCELISKDWGLYFLLTTFYDFLTRHLKTVKIHFFEIWKKRKIRRPILEHWWQLATIASTATGTYAPKLRRTAEAQRTRSLGLSYKLCAVIPVEGQRTHGTTLRAQLPRWQHRGQSLRSLWLLVDIVGHRTGGTAWVTRFSLLK